MFAPRRRRTQSPASVPAAMPPQMPRPFPDGERPPPVRRDFVPARGEEVEAPADQPRRESPQRDLVNELVPAASRLPATHGDRDRRQYGEHVGEAVSVDEQRAEVEPVARRARDERDGCAAHVVAGLGRRGGASLPPQPSTSSMMRATLKPAINPSFLPSILRGRPAWRRAGCFAKAR